MTLKKFIRWMNEHYGESRADESCYKDSPHLRVPDWIRGLVEKAYAEGKKEGKRQEFRRLSRNE